MNIIVKILGILLLFGWVVYGLLFVFGLSKYI